MIKPCGPKVCFKLASTATSALQSEHQCAQKKSRTGWPRSAANEGGLAPSHWAASNAGEIGRASCRERGEGGGGGGGGKRKGEADVRGESERKRSQERDWNGS